MNIHSLIIPLNTSSEQLQRLRSLQLVFAEICNVLSPVVRETKCWNRVALHHMMYRPLREKFPNVGSQMVCNAIYSVSRTSRVVYQSSNSPFNLQHLAEKPLPLLRYMSNAPVYFDRHTLSLKKGSLSMYTLDGRMRFDLNLSDEDLNRFKTWKLNEVILSSLEDQFTLHFSFVDAQSSDIKELSNDDSTSTSLPEYVLIDVEGDPVSTGFPLKASRSTEVLLQTKVVMQTSHKTDVHLGLDALSPGQLTSVHMTQGGLMQTSITNLNLNLKTTPIIKSVTLSEQKQGTTSSGEDLILKSVAHKMTGANT